MLWFEPYFFEPARKAQAQLWTAQWQSGWCSPFPGGYTPCSAFQAAERFNGSLKAGMEPNYHLLPMPAASEEVQSSLRSLHLKRQWVTHDEVVTEDLQERDKTPWPGGILPGCINSKMQQGDYTQTATLDFTKIKQFKVPPATKFLPFLPENMFHLRWDEPFHHLLPSDVYLLPAVTADLKVDETTAAAFVHLLAANTPDNFRAWAAKLNLFDEDALSIARLRDLSLSLAVVLVLPRQVAGHRTMCSCSLDISLIMSLFETFSNHFQFWSTAGFPSRKKWRETIHARPRLSMATAWDLPTLHPCQVVALAWGKLGAAFYDGFGTYATNSDRMWRLVARKGRAPKSPTCQECLDHFGILGRESSQTIGRKETHTECIQVDIAPVHRQTKIDIGFKFQINSTAKIAQALARLKLQSYS